MNETSRTPTPDDLSNSDLKFRSAELLDIPPRCLKCPAIRKIIFDLDRMDASKIALLEGSSDELGPSGMEEVAEYLGTDPEELARKLRTTRSLQVESSLAHTDNHIYDHLSHAQEIVTQCENGPLTMRGCRGGETVTVTTCMSKYLIGVVPPDADNGYPVVEVAAIRREM